MKRTHLTILLAAALSLAACATPGSPSTPTGGPVILSSQVAVSTSTQLAAPTTPPEGSVQYDFSPGSLVIRVTNCCGFVPPLVRTNYIPEALVWGDGRILWLVQDGSGQRQVMEGKLPQEQLSTLLQSAASQGFFEWKELYTEPNSPTDMASKCIEIRPEGTSKQVCEYYSGAPKTFHDLFDSLARGAGAAGKAYIPERIYLKAYRQPATDLPDAPVWDPQAVAFSLNDAIEGAWVEGPALLRAWELVNGNAGGPVVREGESLYQLSVQIPGVSLEEPPPP